MYRNVCSFVRMNSQRSAQSASSHERGHSQRKCGKHGKEGESENESESERGADGGGEPGNFVPFVLVPMCIFMCS